jgi:uncharacterized membrane protein
MVLSGVVLWERCSNIIPFLLVKSGVSLFEIGEKEGTYAHREVAGIVALAKPYGGS